MKYRRVIVQVIIEDIQACELEGNGITVGKQSSKVDHYTTDNSVCISRRFNTEVNSLNYSELIHMMCIRFVNDAQQVMERVIIHDCGERIER